MSAGLYNASQVVILLKRLYLLFSVMHKVCPALLHCIYDSLYIQAGFYTLTVYSSMFDKVIPDCQRQYSYFRMTGLHISRYMLSKTTAFYILFHSNQKTVVL